VNSARSYLHAAARAAWSNGPTDPATFLDLSLATTQATALSVAAVDLLATAAGGTIAQHDHPIARAFRDIHVASSHYTVKTDRFAGAARVVFGDAFSPLM
jgi:alkylation response protein AidB-like acyl-CoA dehydrogenase